MLFESFNFAKGVHPSIYLIGIQLSLADKLHQRFLKTAPLCCFMLHNCKDCAKRHRCVQA